MKPCRKNRKLIAWLTLGALEVAQERKLRAHIETCAGCRRYLEEISTIARVLESAEARTDIVAQESFHHRVLDALSAEESAWKLTGPPLQWLLNWRVAVPALCAAAVMVWALFDFGRRPGACPPGGTTARVAPPTANRQVELQPTLSNYEMVANRSLDQFDELLTRQANRNLPPAPSYRVSSLLPEAATE